MKLPHKPDAYIRHEPASCAACPNVSHCIGSAKVSETRYEIDIIAETHVTAHQVIQVPCLLKGNEAIRGTFPDAVSGTHQYGTGMRALVASLYAVGIVSINRIHKILSGVFGVSLSTGTIDEIIRACAEKTIKTVTEIKQAVIASPVGHFDETGMRVDGKLHWAHVASTPKLTYISIESKRGREGIESSGVLPHFSGTAIHDCWPPYFNYDHIRHGLCNAHILRELTGITENTRQPWAQEMIDLLLSMKHTKERLIQQNERIPARHLIDEYDKRYDAILSGALALNPITLPAPGVKSSKSKALALIERLFFHKGEVCLFFNDFDVPFDNNQAERDFRMLKVKQKVSGCLRTKVGADRFATIFSFVSTAHKAGLSAFFAN